MQLLQQSFTTMEDVQKFKAQLMAGLPPDERVDTAKTVKPTAEFVRDVELGTEHCGHLSMFSFNAGASTKPAPYRTTVTSLVDEYLTNTFLTRGDLLVVTLEHPGFVDWRRLYNSRASSVQYNSDVGTMATSMHSGGSAMATSVQ